MAYGKYKVNTCVTIIQVEKENIVNTLELSSCPLGPLIDHNLLPPHQEGVSNI